MNKKEKVRKVIEQAFALLGKPYKWGAQPREAPNCFDCSSFIQYLFRQIGIKLPRSTIEQIELGQFVFDKPQPGDLIFVKGSKFHKNSKWPHGVGHVALYIGNGSIIHAEGCKHKKVVLENLNSLKLSQFRAIKRIIK